MKGGYDVELQNENNETTPLLTGSGDRKLFLCFTKTRLLLLLLFLLLCCFLALLLLLVGGYFLYPRVPTARIDNEKLRNFTVGALPPSLFLHFSFDVVVDNDNYYDVFVTSVDLDLNYLHARLANFSLLLPSSSLLSARTPNQTIAMAGTVSAFTPSTIVAMINQSTAEGYNTFLLNGTLFLTTSFLPTDLDIYIQSSFQFTPSILPPALFNLTNPLFPNGEGGDGDEGSGGDGGDGGGDGDGGGLFPPLLPSPF